MKIYIVCESDYEYNDEYNIIGEGFNVLSAHRYRKSAEIEMKKCKSNFLTLNMLSDWDPNGSLPINIDLEEFYDIIDEITQERYKFKETYYFGEDPYMLKIPNDLEISESVAIYELLSIDTYKILEIELQN